MKKLTLVLFVVLIINNIYAQKKAITEEGKEVLLFENGTWKYISTEDDEEIDEIIEIPVNSKNFLKDDKATFLLKSTKNKMGFWINPKKWTFKKAQKNEDAEFDLQYKDGDVYGMIISEEMEIPLETLKGIAIDNAKAAAPDIVVKKEEFRYVNGIKILHLELDGNVKGMQFSYIGYYYSNESGTTQLVCFTSQKLKEIYREEIITLLNGLTEY